MITITEKDYNRLKKKMSKIKWRSIFDEVIFDGNVYTKYQLAGILQYLDEKLKG